MTELTLYEQSRQHLPAMTMDQAVERFNEVGKFARTILRPDVDFGIIPGTPKPTLLKPGAEKLTTFFGLSVRYVVMERVMDWTGDDHGGEPFFYFEYRCQLYRDDRLVAESDGSANSREKKYRYRNADRKCPQCDQATIIKGKQEYGGGWLCYKAKGGCGLKFRDDDPTIKEQVTGQIPNPDIADQVNTLQKMSQKRALIAATLLAVNASEFFTQDLEDLVIEGAYTVEPQPARQQPAFSVVETTRGTPVETPHGRVDSLTGEITRPPSQRPASTPPGVMEEADLPPDLAYERDIFDRPARAESSEGFSDEASQRASLIGIILETYEETRALGGKPPAFNEQLAANVTLDGLQNIYAQAMANLEKQKSRSQQPRSERMAR